jgi:3-deoxy-7-phosphoheptulonate synthase
MSFNYIRKLPTPEEIVAQFPVSEKLKNIKAKRDAEIRDVITGKSNKFLVIVGPCSADNVDSVCEYVSKLKPISEKVKDKLILIPRIYTNKPRTTGEGYKGMLHQPNPTESPDMLQGIRMIRRLQMIWSIK